MGWPMIVRSSAAEIRWSAARPVVGWIDTEAELLKVATSTPVIGPSAFLHFSEMPQDSTNLASTKSTRSIDDTSASITWFWMHLRFPLVDQISQFLGKSNWRRDLPQNVDRLWRAVHVLVSFWLPVTGLYYSSLMRDGCCKNQNKFCSHQTKLLQCTLR